MSHGHKFSLGSQLQTVKTPKLPSQPQLKKGKLLVPTSVPQLQGTKTVEWIQGSQLGGMRSIRWRSASELQGVKSLPNVGLQSQCAKPAESKPLIHFRDMQSPVLTPSPKLRGLQSLASLQ